MRFTYLPSGRILSAILLSLNAFLSALCVAFTVEFEFIKNLAVFSFSSFIFACYIERSNVLFLARTLILGSIGYFPLAVKVFAGPAAYFSNYEITTQSLEITILLYVITSFGLLSNIMGLFLGSPQGPSYVLRPDAGSKSKSNSTIYWDAAVFFGVILVLFACFNYISQYGSTVLFSSYAQNKTQAFLDLGVFNAMGIIGIYSVLVGGYKRRIRFWRPLFWLLGGVWVIYAQLLLGLRQDAMTTVFGCIVLWGVLNQKEVGLKLAYIPLVLGLLVFMEVWGVARLGIAAGLSATEMVKSAFDFIGQTEIVHFGTFSPIANTFSNTVWMVQNGVIEYAYGQSYLEWIARIPPEFLYPNRPESYSLMFEEYGLESGGGFFELAEVYMNFGLFGALIIPGFISYLMAKSYYYAFYQQTMWSYFLLFSFLSLFLRGTWYQTFSFFRGFTVILVLYLGYAFIVQALRLRRASLSTRADLGEPS